jgi:hypothetical protein
VLASFSNALWVSRSKACMTGGHAFESLVAKVEQKMHLILRTNTSAKNLERILMKLRTNPAVAVELYAALPRANYWVLVVGGRQKSGNPGLPLQENA